MRRSVIAWGSLTIAATFLTFLGTIHKLLTFEFAQGTVARCYEYESCDVQYVVNGKGYELLGVPLGEFDYINTGSPFDVWHNGLFPGWSVSSTAWVVPREGVEPWQLSGLRSAWNGVPILLGLIFLRAVFKRRRPNASLIGAPQAPLQS